MCAFPCHRVAWILVGICALSGNLPPTFAQERGTTHVCGSTPAMTPHGLAVVLPSGGRRDRASGIEALNNQYLSGAEVQINWRDLEPAEGQLDWSRPDAVMAAAESSGKWIQLAIFPGFFSPAWALAGAKTEAFAIPYGPGHGTMTALPMPWDQAYLHRWFAFVRQLGQRYASSPAFRLIAVAGPTSVSNEMTLPNGPAAVPKWLKDGYTPAKYLAAWDEAYQVYAGALPNQCIGLAGPSLPILEGGKVIDPAARLRARQEIVAHAMQVFGRRLSIQSNDLHAGRAAVEAPDLTDFINSYSGRIITGFEMRGGSQGPGPSEIMGAAGDPPLALRKSINKGMAPNKAGAHVNFLEIYEGDVLAPAMQPVLQYAASLFQQ